MEVYGEALLARFGRKHPAARKPLARFLRMAQEAEWRHFLDVKQTFSTADLAPSPGTLIFDIGGNKYRLIAKVNFEEQILLIDKVLTHEE